MSDMESFMIVPVVDVQSNNFKELWPAMVLAIKTASYIALDTELSGLGDRKSLLAESIEDRFKAICHAARTRSILSLGIACFKKLGDKPNQTFFVQVFNLTLLCSEEYVIDPQSVHFLVQHGFDFNKQYAQGVSYNKGNDKGGDVHAMNVRNLFVEILRANKPLVVHNGLIDMVFLYQCFYAHLPEKLGTFTADLSEMFPSGIFDTKYATEYELRLTASYLEYAFKKCKLDNNKSVKSGGNEPHVFLEFCNYTGKMQAYVDYRTCEEGQSTAETTDVCIQFSAYGWCPRGAQCPMSHDTDLIIQQDEKNKEGKRQRRKRKRGRQEGSVDLSEGGPTALSQPIKQPHLMVAGIDVEEVYQSHEAGRNGALAANANATAAEVMEHCEGGSQSDGPCLPVLGQQEEVASPESQVADSSTPISNPAAINMTSAAAVKRLEAGSHRAGFDAFMTGYIFAYANGLSNHGTDTWLPGCLNKLYLGGKCVPLHVAKSTYSKSSKAHMRKMDIVWGKSQKDHTAAKTDNVA